MQHLRLYRHSSSCLVCVAELESHRAAVAPHHSESQEAKRRVSVNVLQLLQFLNKSQLAAWGRAPASCSVFRMQRSLESQQWCSSRLRLWRYQAGRFSDLWCQYQNASDHLLELNGHRCGFFFPFGRMRITACKLGEEISKLSNISLKTASSRGQELASPANRLHCSCLLLLCGGFLGGFFCVAFFSTQLLPKQLELCAAGCVTC